ncbi:MAG: TetR/AcrR family transcriptional regulator [Actinomycetota bacterium]
MRKRITKQPDVRRQDLVDAAIKVFAEKGINRTTVADLTAAAGVAKGTFYIYFDSKEHLLGALKELMVSEILEHATTLYSRVGRDDWETLLDATVESMTDFFIDRQDMMQVMVQEGVTPETNELFAELETKVDQMFATAIQLGIDSGAFHATDAQMTGRLIHAAFEGTLKNAILYGGGIDRDRFMAAAKEMVRKMLAPPAVYRDHAFPVL